MKIIIIYFFLFTFWITNTTGFSLTGVKGLSLVNLSFYLLFLVWAFEIVFTKRLIVWNSVNTYIIIFIFLVILSIPYKILLDEIPYISLKREIILTKKWIEPYIVFVFIYNILGNKETCKKALFGLSILLLLTALSVPLSSFNIINIGQTSASGRSSGFGDVNQFASYLVLYIPMALTFALFNKSNTIKSYGAVTLFATFFALILSGSRGGILSFAVSMFTYLFMLYNQGIIRLRALFSAMVIILMVGTISFAFAPAKVTRMVLHRLDPSKSESLEGFSSGRLKTWRQSLSLFAEKPIFGHGHHTIIYLMDTRFEKGKVAHNQYLNYLVELGIIGCALFVLIFVKVFQVMWNFQKITSDFWEKKLYISYLAGLFGYTFSMLFVNLGRPREIFWFYTAVLLRYGQLKENDQKL